MSDTRVTGPTKSEGSAGFGDGEFLTLRIGGDRSHPERLLLIGFPSNGTVRVREWTSDTWSTDGTIYDIASAALLADIERAYESRLALSEEMYRLRGWLAGRA